MRLICQRDISGKIVFEPEIHTECDVAEVLRQRVLVFNPLTGEPYIPGSCLKERLGELLRTAAEEATRDMDNTACQLLFGYAENDSGKESAPWRLIIRDALLDEKCLENLNKPIIPSIRKGERGNLKMRDALLKNRLLFLRQNLVFSLNIGIRIYDDALQEEKNMLDDVLYGLDLLEKDGFGSCLKPGLEDMAIDGCPFCLLPSKKFKNRY